MRFGPDDKLWVLTDPTRESEVGDVCFETTVRGLLLQLKGGLDIERNVTLFTEKGEAEVEAFGRLTAMRASQAISERLRKGDGVPPILVPPTVIGSLPSLSGAASSRRP